MSSRFVPYATVPGRLLAQLISDIVIAVWSIIWLLVGMAVHSAVSTIAAVGRQVQTGANGVADNLNTAGDRTDDVPLVGDALTAPLRAASEAALDIAGAGHSLDTTASWLAWVLAIAVAAPPILFVAMPWLFLRIRFFRRKWTAITLASHTRGRTAAGAAGAGQPAARASSRRYTPTRLVRGAATMPSRFAAWPRSNCTPQGSNGSAAERFVHVSARSPLVLCTNRWSGNQLAAAAPVHS